MLQKQYALLRQYVFTARENIQCFQRSIGMSPVNYLNNCRIRMEAKMLLQTANLIMDIGENCGFSSNSYLGKVFRETLGCTPKEYRKKLEK
ncbi:helix-turn-helix transcriptional regulator [Faecalicatena contorta]|nr:helix-turn-helix transcriptional regulator [Faecalicatena contorta]